VTTFVDAPTRVDDVQLIGEMVGSGYRIPPALVRRSDGQVLQLTPLLYLVLNAVDGHRSCDQIAAMVGRGLSRHVTAEDVRSLVDGHLRPMGLVTSANAPEVELKRSNPLLGLKFRVAVTNPRITRRLTDPFRMLFRPVVTWFVILGFVAVVAWVFFGHGLGTSAYDAFQRPHLLLLVFFVSVLSGGFHEFGHAAAARYGGAEPGVMGAGVYIVWPAFYTDVTDSYRLDRAGRLRTDAGGLYFNALVVVLTFVWWWLTGWDAVLLLVATQVMQMVKQVQPLLRFDGYHILADLAGVPDLYHRIKPTLLGLLPHRWRQVENRILTPWARVVITFWVLVTVPLMVLMLVALIAAVPRIVGSAGSAVRSNAMEVADAWHAGATLDVASYALQVLAVVLPILGGALILGRLGLGSLRGMARWSRGSLPKRVATVLLSSAAITALLWAWWPHPGSYRPIQPGERGIFTALFEPQTKAAAGVARPAQEAALRPAAVGTTARERLDDGQPLVATFQQGEPLPTKAHPSLAIVLVPTGGSGSPGGSGATTDEPWVFPFDKPLAPEPGDNQALAVNTTDGSMKYDVAFALVWADGDEVLNVNEAHAYASCSNCVSVAVAFQVVLIMDDAQVVVPQNLAVAANYDCYRCITAALASQLVLSVDGEPGEEELRALGEVWGQLLAFAQSITSYSLTEVIAQLDAFEGQIVAIMGGGSTATPDAGVSTQNAPSPAAEPSEAPAPSTTSPPSPTEASTPPPSPTNQESTSSSTEPTDTHSEPTAPDPSPTPAEETSPRTASPSP
jgi:putative peptide zinc metalloprotease protein